MRTQFQVTLSAMRAVARRGVDPYNSADAQEAMFTRLWRMEAGRGAQVVRSEADANRWLREYTRAMVG